jgi:hypothetical protein
LWFINGKVSLTWNLKQAIVQKPRTSAFVEGTCFIKPKTGDVARLKALPPPEDAVDPEGAAIVDDSDEDEEYELPAPAPVPVRAPAPVVAAPVVVAAAPVAATDETKKKKLVTKKKVDA